MASPSTRKLGPGDVVAGRYRIEGLLGAGGFGAVFRATQLPMGRAVALKVMHSEKAADPSMLERFRREAELAQQLEHPNTVRLFDFGASADGQPFIAWELLRGETLAAAIERGPLAVERVARIAAQVLKSLMEAHRKGIVHRDIKPANVFLAEFAGEPDFVKVLDFGIAKTAAPVGGGRRLTREGQVIGTPHYMAPEQLAAHPATPASDLYALGLSLAEALTGARVMRGDHPADIARQVLSPEPVPLRDEVLAGSLGPVILRATRKSAAARYASAAEMLEDVLGVVEGAPRATSPGPAAPATNGAEPAVPPPPLPATSLGEPLPLPALISHGTEVADAGFRPPASALGAFGPGLTEAGSARSAEAPAPVLPAPPRKQTKRRSRVAPALALAGLVIAILVGLSWTRGGRPVLAVFEGASSAPPLVLTGAHSGSGWIVTFHLREREQALELWYKRPGDPDFISTGRDRSRRLDGTGAPLANTWANIPGLTGRVPFRVKYRDASGTIKGPYTAIFDVSEQAVAEAKQSLRTMGNWLYFRQMGDRPLLYFSRLLNQKMALRSIRYGFNEEPMIHAVPFTQNESGTYGDGDLLYVDLPPGVESVTVELTFLDGTRERKREPARFEHN